MLEMCQFKVELLKITKFSGSPCRKRN